MKIVVKLLLVIAVVTFASCRDTKKEEAETQQVLEQVEAVEQEANEISEKIEQDANELEDALKDLDSI